MLSTGPGIKIPIYESSNGLIKLPFSSPGLFDEPAKPQIGLGIFPKIDKVAQESWKKLSIKLLFVLSFYFLYRFKTQV